MTGETAFYRNVLQNICDGVRMLDPQGKVTFWNKGAELITGFSSMEVLDARCHCLHMVFEQSDLDLCSEACPLKLEEQGRLHRSATGQDFEVHELKALLRHKEGHLVPVILSVYPVFDDSGGLSSVVEMFHDVSWNARALQRIEELHSSALLDELTGLGNAKYARQMITGRMEELNRYGNRFGLALVDLDNYDEVVGDYGRAEAERILKAVALSLSGTLRPFDTICRWKNSQFLVVAANIGTDDNMISLCNRLRLLVEESVVRIKDNPIAPSASIGAALAEPGRDQEHLIQTCDELVLQCGQLGKNIVTLGKHQA